MRTEAEPASTRPSGTVAFLFSDIEGSTQRWEAHREAMEAALARHDTLVRVAIETQGGYVFKTIGDAFCAAFTSVPGAIAAALKAQLALHDEDFSAVDGLRVRMALHAGESTERDDDFFGPTVNRVARLLAIAHGGQVLISGAAADLSQGEIPLATSLRDLGFARLKDLTAPEHVWQLDIVGLPNEFPPLRSLDALPNNLPIQRTSFVGREQDVAEVKELLDRHRLLTLVGSGGVGKTRLAIQVGADLLDRYPDGVWFVDLAPIGDPELVASVVAQAIGMSQQQGRRVDEAIPEWLRRKRLLLIFDNCEHLLEPIAALVDAILATASDVRILATSRQGLDISGEAVHRLPTLGVPAETAGLRSDEALHYGAIALFVDRATAADTRFVLTDDNAPVVAEICRRLDGIALAIELAAARVRVLSIPNLAKRLDERFKLLTGGSRTALPRQQTLSALIGWSYELLTPAEQQLFARVGIFAGSFDLAAAEAVCADEGLEESEVWELLVSLADKSLVVATTAGEEERYHLNESTRAYALEKLDERRDELAARHAAFFAEQARAADARFGTSSTIAWVVEVRRDLDNYRAALQWSLARPECALFAGAIAAGLGSLWFRSLAVEGRYWCNAALERVDESTHPRIAARLWYVLGSVSVGKVKLEHVQRALRLYEAMGDARGAARARAQLAYANFQMGRLEQAERDVSQALAGARTCGDAVGEAPALQISAFIKLARGEASSREMYAEALAAFRTLSNELGIAAMLANLAELEFAEGNVDRCEQLLNEELEIHAHAKRIAGIPIHPTTFLNSAAYRIARGNLREARAGVRDGLRGARDQQNQYLIAIGCQHAALLEALDGDAILAARLMGYADAQYETLGAERESTERWGRERLADALAQRLDGAEIHALASEGAAWTSDAAIDEALRLPAGRMGHA